MTRALLALSTLSALTALTVSAQSVSAQPAPAPAISAQPVTAQAAPAVDAVVAGIQAFYAEATDLKASFTQTYTYKIYNRTKVSNGTVFFKKPGKMRWDYTSPSKKMFLSDGNTLWVYEPEENQAFKRALKSSQLPVALTFMTGQGKLADAFNATLLTSKKADVLKVKLVPKLNQGDYKALVLTVDAATYAVKASTVFDPVGNTNYVVFGGMKTNVGLPDAGFVFTPPAGVQVITGAPRKR